MPRKKLADAPTNLRQTPSPTLAPLKGRRMQMADIARMAGVSTSTVSRALSGSTLIHEDTRQRISELAQSLKYTVNVGAANLRRRDVHTMGVVMLNDRQQLISDPFLLGILGAVADALDVRGMSMLFTRLQEDRKHLIANLVESGQVAGLIVIGQLSLHPQLNELARQGIPMAVWGACLPDAAYAVVGGDNHSGGYQATQHLIEQGCRRIAFFGDTTHPEAGQRFAGYQRALQAAGLPLEPELLQPFAFGDTRIREGIDQWLDRGLSMDGIFATSDVGAISIMGALRERGVRVPQQVRVVGYDDIALSAHVSPSLSTVLQPSQQAGHALVELLFESLQSRPARTVLLPARLVVRDSSR
jgi:DNA-binding LacI/PurR family transcriptional regulator